MVGTDASICMLLDGPITHDGQSQRTVRTLSTIARVLVVASGGSEDDQSLFDEDVEVRPTVRPALSALQRFFLLHRQNDHLAEAGLADGRKFDVVWANDYSTLVPALRIAHATGAKVVYHSHEIWLATINQLFPRGGKLHRRLAFRAIVAICRAIGNVKEPRLAAHADVILTANQSFAQVLSEHLDRSDIRVVLNCPERTELPVSDRIRNELGFAANDRIVLYQGIMNPGRGLHELVASARDFPQGVRLVMLGGGVLEDSLRRAVKDAGLEDRVFMPGTVPHAELPEWTASADLGVLVLDPINLSKRLALANKVFEYMGAGIPVLTTDLPENRRILDQCDCGWLIRDWSPPVLADHIAGILAQPEEMRRRGLNGRRWFEERYNWDVESRRLLDAVDGIIPGAVVAGT